MPVAHHTSAFLLLQDIQNCGAGYAPWVLNSPDGLSSFISAPERLAFLPQTAHWSSYWFFLFNNKCRWKPKLNPRADIQGYLLIKQIKPIGHTWGTRNTCHISIQKVWCKMCSMLCNITRCKYQGINAGTHLFFPMFIFDDVQTPKRLKNNWIVSAVLILLEGTVVSAITLRSFPSVLLFGETCWIYARHRLQSCFFFNPHYMQQLIKWHLIHHILLFDLLFHSFIFVVCPT